MTKSLLFQGPKGDSGYPGFPVRLTFTLRSLLYALCNSLKKHLHDKRRKQPKLPLKFLKNFDALSTRYLNIFVFVIIMFIWTVRNHLTMPWMWIEIFVHNKSQFIYVIFFLSVYIMHGSFFLICFSNNTHNQF